MPFLMRLMDLLFGVDHNAMCEQAGRLLVVTTMQKIEDAGERLVESRKLYHLGIVAMANPHHEYFEAGIRNALLELGYEDCERDIHGREINTSDWNQLFGSDPKCRHDIKAQPRGGVKCCKCGGWFCF